MKLRLTLFAVAVAALGSVGTEAAEPAPPPSPKSSPFDVLYYSEARPVVMRLRITTDGVPLNQAWEGFADALFAKLDTDKSGSLDEKELAQFRPTLTLLTGRVPPPGDARAPMSREGLAAYLQLNDLGPLRLPPIVNNPRGGQPRFRRGGAPTAETLDKALMEFLDTNNDGKLSAAELAAGVEILSKLDVDENEMISMDELLRRPVNSPFFAEEYDPRMGTPGSGVELQSFGRKADPTLAKRLLGRYGPKPEGNPNAPTTTKGPRTVPAMPAGPVESTARRLTPKDLKISAEAFAALDQDGDGELDAEELARFGPSAIPEVEIALRLGTLPAGRAPAEVLSGGGSLKTAAGEGGTDVAVEVSGVRLELVPTRVSAAVTRTAFRSRYLDRFRALDRDGNGYLDSTETSFDPVFRDLFAFLDADGDGKIFEKELVAALDGLAGLVAAAHGLVVVGVTETGRGLFGLIDADGDGRLSVRELRAMSKLVARFDADKDGFLSPGEIPRRFQATLSCGPTSAGFSPQQVAFRPGGMMGTPRPPVGPLWFQKMDRNRDGDVSRREFLGTDEEFRTLDTDGDGLISPQEAEAAGKNER